MMNDKELWLLILSYICMIAGVILITGKWW
nr:MAG TPA: hypothetical protein [Caudoviricetes sp.]DAI51794.1 MAG TPA: hypothetical protein [Caudoviricetes sp.]DAY30026.1 MAG TPA: hypothetical protein [Caudoviricetes sp.]